LRSGATAIVAEPDAEMIDPHFGHSRASSGFSLSSMMVQRDHSSTDELA
jgi:hypothetical protein